MTMTLNGIDISAEQYGIDFAAVPGDFVTIKSTGGDGYANPYLRQMVAAAKAAGKLVGVYHFARDGYTNATAASEAAWFIRNAGDLLDGTVMCVLDWEADNATDVGYAKAWLDTVTAETGVKPVIYISYKDIEAADWSPVANADYGLWEAAYVLGYQVINGYNEPTGRAPIPYWNTLCEWQYTSSGQLPNWGGRLDLDSFYGDRTTWLAYAAKRAVTPDSNNVNPIQQEDPGMSFGPTDPVFHSKDGNPVSLQDILDAIDTRAANIEAKVNDFPSFDTDVRGELANDKDRLAAILAQNDPKAIAAAIPAGVAQAVADELAKRLAQK